MKRASWEQADAAASPSIVVNEEEHELALVCKDRADLDDVQLSGQLAATLSEEHHALADAFIAKS